MTHNQTFTTTVINRNGQRSDKPIWPFEMGYLPPYFKRKAEIELNESPENIEKGMKLMREMAKNDKNFKDQTFDDDFILQFLRCKKYNVDRAFSRFKSFVIMRKNYIDMFTDIRFDRISFTTRDDIVTFLPYRCQDGCAILHIRLGNWDPSKFPVPEVKRAVMVLLAQSLRDPMTQVNGYKVIFNLDCNPLKYVRYCTPSNLYLIYHGPEDCSPGRFKGVHIVNQPEALRIWWVIAKPFFSSKMRQRIIFHSNPENLLDYFPPPVLPQEYGGNLEHQDLTEWLRKVTLPDKLATIGGGPPLIHASRRWRKD